MAAGISDKRGKRELIKPDHAGAEYPARRFAPRIGKVAGHALFSACITARMIVPATAHQT